MSSEQFFTLRDLARQLALPESTVRYYRDVFAMFIPTVGRGRRRLYPARAAVVLGEIARMYAAGATREAIESALADAPEPRTTTALVSERSSHVSQASDEMLTLLVEGERERRELTWQMVREIVRIGEALERQHAVLGALVEQLDGATGRLLPPAESALQDQAARQSTSDAADELRILKEKLAAERELVERLRRSKLELERRAAAAESQLDERQEGHGLGSIFARTRAKSMRHDDPGG